MIKTLTRAFLNRLGAASFATVDNANRLLVVGCMSSPVFDADAVITTEDDCYIDSVNVIIAGSTEGGLHNANATATANNKMAVIPNAVGHVSVRSVFSTGVVLKIGTGQRVVINIAHLSDLP